MQHLKDLPPGTIWPHLLDGIERDALNDLRAYTQSRKNDVTRGAETGELAALLVDKYCEGMAKALHIAGLDSAVRTEGDRLVREIDSEFDLHREARWKARPAALAMAANQSERQVADMNLYSGVMGLQAAILRSKRDGVTRIRVPQAELTRCGQDGIDALKALGAEVEVLYREDAEWPLAEAHVTVLRGQGLAAASCRV
jgi:hypothetical protein